MRKITDDCRGIISKIKSVAHRNTTYIGSPHTIRLLQISIYIWCLLDTFLLLPEVDTFWGNKAYIISKSFYLFGDFEQYLNLLWNSVFSRYYLVFIALQILFLAIGILNSSCLLVRALIYFFVLNVNNKIYPTLDGGNNLIHILLFYNIFMYPLLSSVKENINYFKSTFSNVFLLLCKLQVVCVYFTTALLKLNGSLWKNGMALFYSWSVPEFSLPFLHQLVLAYPSISVLGSYFTLIFQISFPFLIWNKNLRPYVLLIGSAMHLAISFGMGLLTFGLALCVSYFSFYSEEQSKRLLSFFKKGPLSVAFDENCIICMKMARAIKYLDFKKVIIIDKAYSPLNDFLKKVPLMNRITVIHAVELKTGKIYQGYSVILEVMKRVPLFFILIPISILIGYLGLGDIAYNKIAGSHWRKKRCGGSHCDIK